jgi:hypothetical protein
VDDAEHRELGIQLFNRCWELLDHGTLSPDAKEELLTVAFASRYHWSFAGASEQFIVGDWMISRAAGVVGEGHLALTYAQLAYDEAQRVEVPDWLSASVCEGLARAYAANGDVSACEEWITTAERLVASIADDEDRELIAGQLASIPW